MQQETLSQLVTGNGMEMLSLVLNGLTVGVSSEPLSLDYRVKVLAVVAVVVVL